MLLRLHLSGTALSRLSHVVAPLLREDRSERRSSSMHSRASIGRAGAALSAIGRASLLWRPDPDFVRRHRVAVLAVAAAIVVCLGAAFIPWSLPRQTIEREIAAQVKAATGLELVSSGNASFAALPPRITVADVALVDGPRALSIQTRKVRARVHLLPLLAGRLEIAE